MATMQLAADNLTFDGEYAAIPERMREPLLAYVQTGRLPGDFLQAVISNDLRRAVGYADSENLPLLPVYVRWFHNRPPLGCHGSPALMAEWASTGGLAGMDADE